MFDLRDLPAEYRAVGEQIMGEAKKLILKELTLAISELQALEDEMSADNFVIKKPEDYSHHQFRFLSPIIEGMGKVFIEHLEKLKNEKLKKKAKA